LFNSTTKVNAYQHVNYNSRNLADSGSKIPEAFILTVTPTEMSALTTIERYNDSAIKSYQAK
jgi:hypothetical protein